VLHQARNGRGARISFLITARHIEKHVDVSADALLRVLSSSNRGSLLEEDGTDYQIRV
jgi:hypothetical protein